MKTFNQYKPQLEEYTKFFNIPNLLKNIISYVILLLLILFFIGFSYYFTRSKINYLNENLNKTKSIIENNIKSRDDYLDKSKQILINNNYSEKLINRYLDQFNYKKMISYDFDVDKLYNEAVEDYKKAQETINNSIFKDYIDDKDIPKTEEGLKFIEAKNIYEPPKLKSAFIVDVINYNKEALNISAVQVDKAKKFYEGLKAEDEKNKQKELNRVKKEQKRVENINDKQDNIVNTPTNSNNNRIKPTTNKRVNNSSSTTSTPNPTPTTPKNNDDMPSW